MNLINTLRRRARTTAKLYGQLTATCRRDGVAAGAHFALGTARAIVAERSQGDRIPGAVVSETFDKVNGVETTGLISMSSLSVNSPNSLYATVYKASNPELFAEVLSRLPIAYEKYSFVDLGSGKGLALLLASHYPFRRILGLEFAPELHQVAEANIRKYRNPARQCQNVASICGDAAAFVFPNEPLVVYLYHPFDEELMIKVAQRVELSYLQHPRPIVVAYLQPKLRTVWESLKCLRPLFEAPQTKRNGQNVPAYSVFATAEVV